MLNNDIEAGGSYRVAFNVNRPRLSCMYLMHEVFIGHGGHLSGSASEGLTNMNYEQLSWEFFKRQLHIS